MDRSSRRRAAVQSVMSSRVSGEIDHWIVFQAEMSAIIVAVAVLLFQVDEHSLR